MPFVGCGLLELGCKQLPALWKSFRGCSGGRTGGWGLLASPFCSQDRQTREKIPEVQSLQVFWEAAARARRQSPQGGPHGCARRVGGGDGAIYWSPPSPTEPGRGRGPCSFVHEAWRHGGDGAGGSFSLSFLFLPFFFWCVWRDRSTRKRRAGGSFPTKEPRKAVSY